MARIAADVTWLIGRTPLVELSRLSPAGVRIAAKLEQLSPSGSNKDRAAMAMIQHAERTGALQPGGTIVECSSGDLGLAIAMVGRRRGFRVVLTMPEWLPQNRLNLLRILGAEVVMTPAEEGMRGAIARAESIVKQTPGAICLQAFTNRANARIHAETTAREIWEDTDGKVATVVCPVGTGGTAAGCLAFFREFGVEVIGVEPSGSAVLTGGPAGPHDIPGIGAGFIPGILGARDLNGVVTVSDADAVEGVRSLANEESILTGPSGGAVVHAALVMARRPYATGKLIVAVLPDSADRTIEHRAFRGNI
jgi:cysteine synthase A